MKTDTISTQEWGDWSMIYTQPRLTEARLNTRGVAALLATLIKAARADYISACIACLLARESGVPGAITKAQESLDEAGEFFQSDLFLIASPWSAREYMQQLEAEAIKEARNRAEGRRYKDRLRQERYEKRLCVNCGAPLPAGFTKVCCQACNDKANLSRQKSCRAKYKA